MMVDQATIQRQRAERARREAEENRASNTYTNDENGGSDAEDEGKAPKPRRRLVRRRDMDDGESAIERDVESQGAQAGGSGKNI